MIPVTRKVTVNEMSRYVLTVERFQECLVRGAALVGIIPEDVANVEFDRFGSGQYGVQVEHVANGVILELPNAATGVPVTPGAFVKLVNQPPGSLPNGLYQATATEAVVDEGPPPEKVKEALAKVMARLPSIATIRKWSSKERRAAIRWAKSGADDTKRPAHVVPPAPRGSRTETTTTEPTGEVSLFETEEGEDEDQSPDSEES